MTAPSVSRVDHAIEQAIREVRRRQAPDGGWESPCDQGPATTAQAAIVLAWLGALQPGSKGGLAPGIPSAELGFPSLDGRRAPASRAEPELRPRDSVRDPPAENVAICRWLVSRQLPDGGWPSGPLGGEAELGATAIVWAALVRLGCDDTAAVERARRRLDAAGGVRAAGARVREADAAPWFLALAGVLDGRSLPRLPLAWRRSRRVVRWLEAHVHDGIQLLVAQLGAIGRRLSGDWPEQPTGRARADADAVLGLLDLYQNPDGSWGGFVPIHALALAAAWSCGDRGPRVQRGVAWLRSRMMPDATGVGFSAYDPDTWVTGITLRALRLAGVAPTDPVIVRGAAALLAGQSQRPMASGLDRRPASLRVGGWAFSARNPALPDTDDTGIALLALSGLDPAAEPALALAEAWLRGMQNPDGAFPAFTWDVSRRPTGPFVCPAPGGPMNRHVVQSLLTQLTDYPSEDVAGRLLRTFAARGARLGDPTVDATIRWLRAQQGEHGGWWGRWVTPYVAPTADVLGGLHAVGVPEGDPAVDQGIGFLLARQNEDGGWGETPEAYVDPARAGVAPSSAVLTGWVIPGLLPWLGPDHAAVRRGVAYLLQQQRPGGDWSNGNHVHVYLPPDRVYVLPASSLMHPLEALAMWRSAASPRPALAR